MTSEMVDLHSKYITNYLINEILEKLNNETLESFTIKDSGSLDGFMSALYNIDLKTKASDGSLRQRLLIVKFMKGDESFRESCRSGILFGNEVYIYSTIMPEYEKVIKDAKVDHLSVKNWVPDSYVAKYGYVEGLSPTKKSLESVLVLENLKPKGYTLGPRLYLSLDQLFQMCRVVGEFHSMSYVLRESNQSLLNRLVQGIVPLSFIDDRENALNFYDTLYRLAFDRFFEFFERKVQSNSFDRKNPEDLLMIECVMNLKEKYFDRPTKLMEFFRTQIDREDDRHFSVILHGDYNRNNVLFHKKEGTGEGDDSELEVDDIKMIDFQELRVGTPCIDLSFFMYFNSTKYIRENHWDDLLMKYHSAMFETLSLLLKSNKSHEEIQAIEQLLEKYNYENFVKHFSKNAFYGVMICMHFLPWLLCSEDECATLSHYFEKDMNGEEFRKISLEAGGDDVNEKILDIVKHACRLGYMDFL